MEKSAQTGTGPDKTKIPETLISERMSNTKDERFLSLLDREAPFVFFMND